MTRATARSRARSTSFSALMAEATQVYRGIAKVLEDRLAECRSGGGRPTQTRFAERSSRRPPSARKGSLRTRPKDTRGQRARFEREPILASVAAELKLAPEAVASALFADLRDENRLLRFEDISAERLIDRYNVALAQAVLLRSVLVRVEVRNERPARFRQLFRRLKFHRLLYRVEGTMRDGYVFHIDGPLSLFAATTKYGLQVAVFVPAAVHCEDFRLEAEAAGAPGASPGAFSWSRATAWSHIRATSALSSRPS